jgi:simple sugar transport system ATP-binding protein
MQVGMPGGPASDAAAPVPLVALSGIGKRFGDVVANDDVHFDVRPGEVHAILGENGAGKTTLMRILYGLSTADSGTIEVNGTTVRIGSPKDALRHGIGMVTQHFALVGPMSVTDNVLLTSSGLGPLDRATARRRVLDLVDQLGVGIDPDAIVEDLSVGEQQRVEIIKALYQGAKVLILDEPTAVLVPQESQALLDAVRRLTAEGLGVVFISHKLHEVAAISQRVSVLRHGRIVSTMPTAGASPAELAELMVGRSVAAVLREERRVTTTVTADDAPPLLKVESLSLAGESGAKPLLHDIALTVRSGEILALAGVSGNGQRELADVLSGVRRPTTGSVTLDGADITHATPRGLLEAGAAPSSTMPGSVATRRSSSSASRSRRHLRTGSAASPAETCRRSCLLESWRASRRPSSSPSPPAASTWARANTSISNSSSAAPTVQPSCS